MRRIIVGFVFVGLLGLLVSCEDTVFGKSTYRYEVTGTVQSVRITMSIENETTVQRIETVPWVYTFEKDNIGSFSVYLSVQNQGEDGIFTVKIYRNGKVVRQATSTGAYSIATVSYSWGD